MRTYFLFFTFLLLGFSKLAFAQFPTDLQHAIIKLHVINNTVWFNQDNEFRVLDLSTMEDVSETNLLLKRGYIPFTSVEDEHCFWGNDSILIIDSNFKETLIAYPAELSSFYFTGLESIKNSHTKLGKDSLLIQGFFSLKNHENATKFVELILGKSGTYKLPDYKKKYSLSPSYKIIKTNDSPMYLVDTWKVIRITNDSELTIDLSSLNYPRNLATPIIGADQSLWVYHFDRGLLNITDKVNKRYDFKFKSKQDAGRPVNIELYQNKYPLLCTKRAVALFKDETWFVLPQDLDDDELIFTMKIWKNTLILGTSKGLRMKEIN